jgi:hypothetical protein
MAGSSGYLYVVRMAPTALTAGKTLIQVVAGAAPFDVIGAKVSQVTKSTSELLRIQLLRKTAVATVTSATPLLTNPSDPVSLAIGGTSLTGVNATAEGTNGDVVEDAVWNILNGTWEYLPIPEARKRAAQAGNLALVLITAPAASMTIAATLEILEYR